MICLSEDYFLYSHSIPYVDIQFHLGRVVRGSANDHYSVNNVYLTS